KLEREIAAIQSKMEAREEKLESEVKEKMDKDKKDEIDAIVTEYNKEMKALEKKKEKYQSEKEKIENHKEVIEDFYEEIAEARTLTILMNLIGRMQRNWEQSGNRIEAIYFARTHELADDLGINTEEELPVKISNNVVRLFQSIQNARENISYVQPIYNSQYFLQPGTTVSCFMPYINEKGEISKQIREEYIFNIAKNIVGRELFGDTIRKLYRARFSFENGIINSYKYNPENYYTANDNNAPVVSTDNGIGIVNDKKKEDIELTAKSEEDYEEAVKSYIIDFLESRLKHPEDNVVDSSSPFAATFNLTDLYIYPSECFLIKEILLEKCENGGIDKYFDIEVKNELFKLPVIKMDPDGDLEYKYNPENLLLGGRLEICDRNYIDIYNRATNKLEEMSYIDLLVLVQGCSESKDKFNKLLKKHDIDLEKHNRCKQHSREWGIEVSDKIEFEEEILDAFHKSVGG
ncbi:MAG: hypothetical protein ACOC5A_03720, partial [Halanaerobiales bacterium]